MPVRETSSARAAVALGAYVLAVIGIGALTAPWVNAGLALSGIELPLHKFALRWMQLLALVGLWPLLKHLGFGLTEGLGVTSVATAAARPGVAVAGTLRSEHKREDLLLGLAWGVGTFAVVAALLLLLGVREFVDERLTMAGIGVALFKAAVTATAVALVEELWFRGGLHTVAVRVAGVWGGIALVAGLYASLHFVRADSAIAAVDVRWWSGFEVLWGATGRFTSASLLADFTALFVAGCWLGVMRQRRSLIWICIGLHAGWVLVIRLLKQLTVLREDTEWLIVVGRFDGVIGWAAALIMLAALGLMATMTRRQ